MSSRKGKHDMLRSSQKSNDEDHEYGFRSQLNYANFTMCSLHIFIINHR